MDTQVEDGFRVVDGDPDPEEPSLEVPLAELDGDGERETLRDAFVEAFNARDLEAVLDVVHPDVECPDRGATSAADLADQLTAIWHRSPGAILTRAFLDGAACAVAWLPDDDGCWSRAALVCFEAEDGLIRLLDLADDPDGLDQAEADDPDGEELDEGASWAEWQEGEEATPTVRR